MGEEAIEFSARFGGKLEHITVPYGAVAAIYAKENGAGTSFPIEHPVVEEDAAVNKPKASKIAKLTSITSLKPVDINIDSMPKESTKKKGKASLKVIK